MEAIISRRGFLKSIFALAAAPAIVRADSLMRIVPRDALVMAPPGWMNRVISVSAEGGEWALADVTTLADHARLFAPAIIPEPRFIADCMWDPTDDGRATGELYARPDGRIVIRREITEDQALQLSDRWRYTRPKGEG